MTVMRDVGHSGPTDLTLKMPQGKSCPSSVSVRNSGLTSLAEQGRGRTETSKAELSSNGL